MPKKKKDDGGNVVPLHGKKALRQIVKRMPAKQPPPEADEAHITDVLSKLEDSFWAALDEYQISPADAARMLTVMLTKMVCGGDVEITEIFQAGIIAKQLIDLAAQEESDNEE